mmetsp:Transcript_28948/g.69886  ORF Transcript_28948/g.69886 Transcript_28948/m.69886 type:complete len:104 (-) Transcript_28948:8-319(-)
MLKENRKIYFMLLFGSFLWVFRQGRLKHPMLQLLMLGGRRQHPRQVCLVELPLSYHQSGKADHLEMMNYLVSTSEKAFIPVVSSFSRLPLKSSGQFENIWHTH